MVYEHAKWVKEKDKWLSFVLNIVWYLLLEEMMIIKEIGAEIVIKTDMHINCCNKYGCESYLHIQ